MLHEDSIMSDEEAKQIIMELYDKGHGIATYVIVRILGPRMTPDEKEDLIHEAFLKLIPYVEQLRNRSMQEQLAYFSRVVRTVALDEARRRTRMYMIDSLDSPDRSELESPNLSPEEFCMMQNDIAERTRHIQAALARLSDRDRTLLIEKYQNGRNDTEIGALMGIKPRNVRVYIARARHKVAIYYGEEADGKKKQEHGSDVGGRDQII